MVTLKRNHRVNISEFSKYDKVYDGIAVLKRTGLTKIRNECSHFNEWLTKLEQLK